jgi:DnaA family protein
VSEPGTRQLPLALRYPPDQRFGTCVGIVPEALAQLRALAAGDGDDSDNTSVYLAGPSGTGKTHLALATCAAAEAAGRNAAYLPLQAAAGRMRDALDALERATVVALDGIDAIAGNRDDEVALFDFHNRARAAGVALLYAGRAAPDGLPLALPDLRSRLSQCARIVLVPLDDEGRREVLRERARRRGLSVDPAALEWLMRRVGRDLGGLARLFDRLDQASLAAQRRLTVPFLRETLRED